MEVRRSALVAHPAERLFTLIEAAEDYPAFLPWCSGVTILERSEEMVSARIEVAWRGVRFGFVTRNPKRAPLYNSSMYCVRCASTCAGGRPRRGSSRCSTQFSKSYHSLGRNRNRD